MRFSTKKVNRYLKLAQISLEEATNASGVHPDTVRKWQAGGSPGTRLLGKFRNVLERKTGLKIYLDDLLVR